MEVGLFAALKEEFSSAWTLLNDTSTALSRANLFLEYEKDLKTWRSELQFYGNDIHKAEIVKNKVKELRSHLRTLGLELILGQRDIQTAGWRHDDAINEGFRRCVLLVTERTVYWIVGDVNHNELKEMLERRVRISPAEGTSRFHCLWYRWWKSTLQFSGADSEGKDQWNSFCLLVKFQKNFLIKALKKMP